MSHRLSTSLRALCLAGLLSSAGVAVAAGPAAADGSGSTFCLISNSLVNSSLPAVPSSLPSAGQVGSIVSSLVTLTTTAEAASVNASSSAAKNSLTTLAGTANLVVGKERQVLADLSKFSFSAALAAQRAAASLAAGLPAQLQAAETAVYQSCPQLVPAGALTKASVVSAAAVAGSKAAKRVVGPGDLLAAAKAVPGVVVVSNISASQRIAKFSVTVAPSMSARVCVKEPSTVGGTPSPIGVC